MMLNMPEAKNQLSRPMKPGRAAAAGLQHPGGLAAASPALTPAQLDAAFTTAVEQEVAELFSR